MVHVQMLQSMSGHLSVMWQLGKPLWSYEKKYIIVTLATPSIAPTKGGYIGRC